MREYPGRTLAELFKHGGPLPLDQWQDLAQRLLRAVGMLHRRNILHRDIKPENLLLGDDGELRVLDFGLACCPGLTPAMTEHVAGTPSFIAPEAFAGEPPAASQDLYATGVTLYFLLTGHYPYGEIEAFQQPRFGQPQNPSRYRPDVPDWLCLNLLRSVSADPQHRYETAEEWLLKLDQDSRHPPTPRARPLLEREPLKVWRSVALASVLTNLILIFWLLH
jgi:serine/threonine protein kinase